MNSVLDMRGLSGCGSSGWSCPGGSWRQRPCWSPDDGQRLRPRVEVILGGV